MKARSSKAIVTWVVTGSTHTPTMSDALPVTPNQIAEQAIAAASPEAGLANRRGSIVMRRTDRGALAVGRPTLNLQAGLR
jgi:hypothetical protein